MTILVPLSLLTRCCCQQDSDVIDMLTLQDDEVHLVSWQSEGSTTSIHHHARSTMIFSLGSGKSISISDISNPFSLYLFSNNHLRKSLVCVVNLFMPILYRKKIQGCSIELHRLLMPSRPHITPWFARAMTRNTSYKSVSQPVYGMIT